MENKKVNTPKELGKITKIEQFDIPSDCDICDSDMLGDPYKFTLDNGDVFWACDTCGENLICAFSFSESLIIKYE